MTNLPYIRCQYRMETLQGELDLIARGVAQSAAAASRHAEAMVHGWPSGLSGGGGGGGGSSVHAGVTYAYPQAGANGPWPAAGVAPRPFPPGSPGGHGSGVGRTLIRANIGGTVLPHGPTPRLGPSAYGGSGGGDGGGTAPHFSLAPSAGAGTGAGGASRSVSVSGAGTGPTLRASESTGLFYIGQQAHGQGQAPANGQR